MPSVRYYAKKPAGKPTRECQKCHKFYHPRSKACPSCGAVNPTVKSAKRRMKRRKVRAGRQLSESNSSPLDAAIEFVQAVGGVENAKAAMDRIEIIRGL